MLPQKEQFIAWLNDAYSTELSLIPVLKNHAADAEDYPEIRDRDLQHLEETRHQAERLKGLIESLGGRVSTVKSFLGSMLGQGQSISTEFFSDEITKNFLQDYAAENFEIASYKALIETARQIGEHQCIPVLEEILREEEAMARWIENHLPLAVHIGLEKAGTPSSNRNRGIGSNLYGKVKENKGVSSVVIGGAIAAAALYLMRSNEKQHERRVEKVRHIPHNYNEGSAGRHISTAPAATGAPTTDESGGTTSEIGTSDNLTRAARGNS